MWRNLVVFSMPGYKKKISSVMIAMKNRDITIGSCNTDFFRITPVVQSRSPNDPHFHMITNQEKQKRLYKIIVPKKKRVISVIFLSDRTYKIIINKGFYIGADKQDKSYGKKEKNTNRTATN
jgi:hypothetical protein